MSEFGVEREGVAQDEAARIFDVLYPGIRGNPFIPHMPHPKQLAFLGAHVRAAADPAYEPDDAFECLYGGAAGGGKSNAILTAAVQYVHIPTFAGVCIRRSHAELSKPGALMSRAKQWWLGDRSLGVHWDGQAKIFTFPSGAKVQMGYHGHVKDNTQYQGAEYQFVSFDELTHWEDDTAYEWIVHSRMRRNEGEAVPLRALSGSNPGGPGHVWVRDYFPGTVGKAEFGDPLYIPATLDDNPSLDRAAYVRSLRKLHPTVRAQLLQGDWRAREPGDYYRADWFGMLIEPEDVAEHARLRVRWWDLAASEDKTAARTAGVLMSRFRSGVRCVEHAVAFRKTPGARDVAIIRQAKLDGPGTIVGLELEPGSGGVAQVETLSRQLKRHGIRCVWARPKTELTDAEGRTIMRQQVAVTGKAGRSAPVASCLERGAMRRGEILDLGDPEWGADLVLPFYAQRDGLRLVNGPWTQGYLDEIEGFPDAALLDFADATAGAWGYLEAHPQGITVAPTDPKVIARAEAQNVHPDDRPDFDTAFRGVGESGHRSRAKQRHAPV